MNGRDIRKNSNKNPLEDAEDYLELCKKMGHESVAERRLAALVEWAKMATGQLHKEYGQLKIKHLSETADLRGKLSAALEALADQAKIAGTCIEQVERLTEKNAKMQRALKPFADEAKHWDPTDILLDATIRREVSHLIRDYVDAKEAMEYQPETFGGNECGISPKGVDDSGELELELDVNGVKGSVFLSREMLESWEGLWK